MMNMWLDGTVSMYIMVYRALEVKVTVLKGQKFSKLYIYN